MFGVAFESIPQRDIVHLIFQTIYAIVIFFYLTMTGTLYVLCMK